MPTTTEGKAVSAQNALKHGLTARQIVLPSESEDDWHDFRQAYLEDIAPEGIVETDLALRAAELAWRLRRVAAAEREAVLDRDAHSDRHNVDSLNFMKYHSTENLDEFLPATLPVPAALRPITRYEAHLSRQYFQVTNRLQQLQDRRTGRSANIHRVEIHGFPGKKLVAQPSPAVHSPNEHELPNEPQQAEVHTGTDAPASPGPSASPNVPLTTSAASDSNTVPIGGSVTVAELPNELPPIFARIPGLTPEIYNDVRRRVLQDRLEEDGEEEFLIDEEEDTNERILWELKTTGVDR